MLNRCTDWIKGENLRARNIGRADNSDGPRRTHHRRFAGLEDAERLLRLCRSRTRIHGQCEGGQVEPWPRTVSTPLRCWCGPWAVVSGDGGCSVTGFSLEGGGVLGCEGQFTPFLLRPASYSSEPLQNYHHVCSPQNKIKPNAVSERCVQVLMRYRYRCLFVRVFLASSDVNQLVLGSIESFIL